MAMYGTSLKRPQQGRPDVSIAPTMSEVVGVTGVWLFYLMVHELLGREANLTASLVGPLALTTILGMGAWRMVRIDGKNVWTALFWFRLSTAIYFGLGTYAVFIANNITRLYLETFHQFFDDEIFKLNLVVSLSVAIVLATARIVIVALERSRRAGAARSGGEEADRTLPLIGGAFLVIGLVITYTIKVPQDFGWTSGEWSGTIIGLSRLTMIGIFMLTLWSLERARWFLPVISMIAFVEMLLQLLLFAKAGIMMTLLLYLLAFLWRGVTLRRSVISAVVTIAVFTSIQPIVGYARHELEISQSAQAGFGRRLEILLSFASADTSWADGDEHQGTLLRISYVNAATFVIRQYDMGIPGEWPSLLPAVFVPRFFWPEKPIISDVGLDIYELGTGRRTSSAGAGVFADAYWAMGWWGVVVYMPVYGFILGLLSFTTVRLLREGRWVFFPVILLAMLMGTRADGHYITDVAGATTIITGMFVVLLVVERFFGSLAPRSAGGIRHVPSSQPVRLVADPTMHRPRRYE